MAVLKLDINGKAYPVLFGYGAFKLLGVRWKVSGVSQLMQTVATTFSTVDNTDFSFEQMDKLAELVFSGIQNAKLGKDLPFTLDDVAMAMLLDASKITDIIKAFVDSMPKADKGCKKGK